MISGKYIVIEGAQGTGKTTQIALIAKQLQAADLAVRVLREPDSQSDVTARTIRAITQDPLYPMNSRTEVLLYNAARSQSLDVIRQSIQQGITCLVDRNYLTTLAMQYYGRGDIPDYQTINNIINFATGGTEPDLTVILDAPVYDLKKRIMQRRVKERFDELDESFLERVRSGYLWEARRRNLPVIFATNDIDKVFRQVWQLVTQTMAQRTKMLNTVSAISISNISEPFITKGIKGTYSTTEQGTEFLNGAVTNSTGNVYAFTEKLSPVTIAASMARLSRRGDDMRITLLDEFSQNEGKDEKLLQRVITAYGDDSVQQLVGQHVVVENASNLLTKKLEWGRLAAYLEQSTRYIYFDQKDSTGKYKYFTPEYLEPSVKQKYQNTMDTIFDLYSKMVRKLTMYVRDHSGIPVAKRDAAWQAATRAQACDAVRPVLPVAVKSTVGIYASGQALESLITHLLSDELPEAYATGRELLHEARKVLSMFLERVDITERGVAMQGYKAFTRENVKDIALKYLPDNYGGTDVPVRLVSYWPRNELDLVPDMLYEHSSLTLDQITDEVNHWPINKKEEVLKIYMGERLNRRHRPGRAIEKAHYSWDLLCDYGIFRDLQRHKMVDAMEWQTLSPRYGFEVPELIDEAGLVDDFNRCFDLSLELYSAMQKHNYNLEAQYATLLGHKMRWKVTYNARQAFHLHELRTSPQGHPGYRKLVNQMHEQLSQVHPMIAEAMIFVNKDEDPKLTRLAAERYTQHKLKRINKSLGD